MRHLHPPIHAAFMAVAVVAGLASYQGVDKLVLAKGGATYAQSTEPGHQPSSTSTTVAHHEPTTSTTVHNEPSTTSTTSTPVHHEPPPSTTSTTPHTSTTEHHEPPHTSTTVHHEPAPSTTTTAPAPPATPAQLSLSCISGFTEYQQGASKCSWSPSTSPNFGHYRLTRELVGTPRQTIFESSDRNVTSYIDVGLQAGAQYSYIIEAYDAAGNLIARGGPFHFTCCGSGGTA